LNDQITIDAMMREGDRVAGDPHDRATISDVARAAGVSRQTISNVLNNPERVAPETLERVRAVIAQRGYRPNAAAKQLRQRRAHALGIELDVTGRRRVSGVLTAFLVETVLAARSQRASIVPFVAMDHEAPLPDFEDLVQRQMVDGFILVDTRHGDPRPGWLRARDIPFVSFGRIWDDPQHTTWADVDGAAGVRAAVAHVLEWGAHRVAFLGWPEGSPTGDERRRGWVEATTEAGIHDPSLAVTALQDVGDATRAATELMGRLSAGDAIVCASDELAMGALRAVRAAGLQPGTDCAVVGFDDGPLAEALGLTTMRQPVEDIAAHLVAIATSLTDGSPPPDEGRLFEPALVVRSTTTRGAPVPPEEG
jgi:DNA-binding LacI/PurR family transcriptional regulator